MLVAFGSRCYSALPHLQQNFASAALAAPQVLQNMPLELAVASGPAEAGALATAISGAGACASMPFGSVL